MTATMSIINQQTGITQVSDITSRFPDFISWIDRGEKTTRTYLTNLRQFASWMTAEGIKQPNRDDIIRYREYLEGKGCKPTTIRTYMQTVRAFFSWAAAAGIYPDIASNIHTPTLSNTHRKDALDRQGVLAVERSIQANAETHRAEAAASRKDTEGRMQRASEQDKRLYAMYLLTVNCGLRTVEISRANIGDLVQRGEQSFLRIQGKGHAEADTLKALAGPVADAIRDYLESRTDDYSKESPLFVSTGNRSGGKRIATTTISTMLKKAMQAAGYDDERLTAHSLRHTAGQSVMELTGNNIYETQNFMRHSSPATTEIYLHTDAAKLDAKTATALYSYYHAC